MFKADIFSRFLGNGEIYWRKLENLQGNFDVKLVIFPKSELHEGEIVFSAGEPFENIKSSTASFETIDSFSIFLLETSIRINNKDHINIYFTGNETLLIKQYPQSYVMLTNIVIKKSSTVNEKTAITTVVKQTAKTNVMDCHCVKGNTETILLIELIIIIIIVLGVLNIFTYIKLKRYKYHII